VAAVTAVTGLALAAAAGAHLSIDPASVHTGDLVDLVFSVPNVGSATGIDHVTLGVPQDFDLDDVEAKSGWTSSRTGQAVTWSGGMIPKGTFARFTIRGTAPAKAETVLFNVLVGDRKGRSITYRVGLDVTATTSEDSGARSLGKAALGLAIAAGVLALGALFLGLYLWLRPPPL
jgi:uncharacterized protein YcnI